MANKFTFSKDVRMRGFAERTDVETALEWIDAHAPLRGAEQLGLEDAHGRVLAEDVSAAISVPPFDRAAMDGYALRGGETHGAGDYNPLTFRIVGESLPGRPFAGSVEPGTAVQIMTGAPVPAGADAVLPAEYAEKSDGEVHITTSITPGKHVSSQGEDIAAGSRMLAKGRRLRPQDVGVLASVGRTEVPVTSRPRVRILVTGNELVRPGQPRGEFQIFDANSSMLCGLAARDGGLLDEPRHLDDSREAIREALLEPGADLILVSGGSSVGAEDHAPSILAEQGELAIHGIAMRPSSPTGLGRIGERLVCLLPGNPVSCLCAYDFFAGRALRLMGGRQADWPYATRTFTLARKVTSAVGRLDYCRIQFSGDQIEPIAVSGASILSSTTRADGFILVPAESEGYAAGSEVPVFLYDQV